jgi:hypothetical protein
MKAITLWQPWASLLACEAKLYETRNWAASYRGPIAIHASLKKPSDVLTGVDVDLIFTMGHAFGIVEKHVGIIVDFLDNLPCGSIIAVAELVECHPIVAPARIEGMISTGKMIKPDMPVSIYGNELLFGDWTTGRYAWEFSDMKMLPEPIPARGGQRIWNWNDEATQAGKP